MNSPDELIGNGPNVASVVPVTVSVTCEVALPSDVVTPQPEPKTSTVEPGFAVLGLSVIARFWMLKPDEVAARARRCRRRPPTPSTSSSQPWRSPR